MMLSRILRTLKFMQIGHKAPTTSLAVTDSDHFDLNTANWPQIDRRQIEDRRSKERRTTFCQPYLDTRKNHGRRRSLGRRLNDQVTSLPF